MNRTPIQTEVYVVVRCVACSNRRKIRASEVPKDSVPFCEKCHNPMATVGAVASG